MEIGVVIPQGRLLLDREAVRAFAEAAQDLGYSYLTCFDHVLGADPTRYHDRLLHFTTADPFHEPFTLFCFINAFAPRLGLRIGVLILPQRQTALVAKQAAEVDFLSGGKLQLGVGTGWNDVEYQALGIPWEQRGRRLDEQIEVLRLLWTQEKVTYNGTFHTLDEAGINPRPVQQPIPIWVGGESKPALRRAALLGDGYLVKGRPPADPEQSDYPRIFEHIRELRRSSGLTNGDYGFEGRPIPDTVDGWETVVRSWEGIGATQISVTTLGNLRKMPGAREQERLHDAATTVDDHIADLEQTRAALSAFFP